MRRQAHHYATYITFSTVQAKTILQNKNKEINNKCKYLKNRQMKQMMSPFLDVQSLERPTLWL